MTKTGIFIIVLVLLIILGVTYFMTSEKKTMTNYYNRKPRILRLEIGAAYDQIVELSGIDVFNKMSFKSNDYHDSFIMNNRTEPSMSPVIVSYGFPKSIFELPPSSYVNVIFQTAHMIRFTVKPLITPLNREDTITLAKSLIILFNGIPSLKYIPDDNITLDEVWLRMQLLASEMDKTVFEIGNWQQKEKHYNANISLSIEVLSDSSITDPAKQLYSVDLIIGNYDDKLTSKLESIKLKARTKIKLYEDGETCTSESYGCDIPDVREYLDTLRKEKLIPLK